MRPRGRPVDADVANHEELDKLEVAIQHLERAELYVVAALELGFADSYRRRLLEDLRGQVASVRRSLTLPRVVDQALSR